MKTDLKLIEKLGLKELGNLPIYDLADLDEQLNQLSVYTRRLKERLDTALRARFSDEIKYNLPEGRNSGNVTFSVGGCKITVVIGEHVIWDAGELTQIIDRMSIDKLKELINDIYSIDEDKFARAREEDRGFFLIARKTTPGKAKFRIRMPAFDTRTPADGYWRQKTRTTKGEKK